MTDTTYFVADTHLCDGTGPFARNAYRFVRFLRDIVAEDDLVIVGDFVDLYRWRIEAITRANRDICDIIGAKENVRLVVGNHDLSIDGLRPIFQGPKDIVMSLTLHGWLVIHGHQLDARLDEPSERTVVRNLSLAIQWLNWGWLNRVRDWATDGIRDNRSYKERFEGINLIMAHTHVPEVTAGYANPGSWTGATPRYLVMDKYGHIRLKAMEA